MFLILIKKKSYLNVMCEVMWKLVSHKLPFPPEVSYTQWKIAWIWKRLSMNFYASAKGSLQKWQLYLVFVIRLGEMERAPPLPLFFFPPPSFSVTYSRQEHYKSVGSDKRVTPSPNTCKEVRISTATAKRDPSVSHIQSVTLVPNISKSPRRRRRRL